MAPDVPVPLVMPMVTEAALLATRIPLLSFTCTITAGEMETPAAVLLGSPLAGNASVRPVCGHAKEVFKLVVEEEYTQT
jgi:hypothetical protein